MLFICLKIFFARILDVSISTFRTMVLVRGRKFYPAILAFFEVLIWFFAAREALNTEFDSFLIPISYSLGYATGSLIGTLLSHYFIKKISGVEVITEGKNEELISAIKKMGFGLSIIKLENKKYMLYIQLNNHSIKKLENVIKKYDKKAFVIVNDTKYVLNGIIK